MRLSPQDAKLVADLEDAALDSARRGPKIDEPAAAAHYLGALRRAEMAGLAWASAVLDDCLAYGVAHRLRRRVKNTRIAVTGAAGTTHRMPVAYSEGRQLSLWVYKDRSWVKDRADELARQGLTLTHTARVLRRVLEVMDETGTLTAYDAFTAAGLDPASLTFADLDLGAA